MFIQKNKNLHILIFYPEIIPALKYGGTERVVWDLIKTLHVLSYKITLLTKVGSICPMANVIYYNKNVDINEQIPTSVDLVHCHTQPPEFIKKPYVITIHGNPDFGVLLDKQSIFVSKNHAERYQSNTYVHNGLDWDKYKKPQLNNQKEYYHFLANASWKVKNLKGAIRIAKLANQNLAVLGGHRVNFKMGFRLTLDKHVSFKGMVDNDTKSKYLNQSKGLLFPVLWHEPFGLAIIESLYFGCPVFGTPYGSLTEIVHKEVGFLSNKTQDIVDAMKNNIYHSKICYDYAIDKFSADFMTKNYINLYEMVLNGAIINDRNPTLKENKLLKYLPFN